MLQSTSTVNSCICSIGCVWQNRCIRSFISFLLFYWWCKEKVVIGWKY